MTTGRINQVADRVFQRARTDSHPRRSHTRSDVSRTPSKGTNFDRSKPSHQREGVPEDPQRALRKRKYYSYQSAGSVALFSSQEGFQPPRTSSAISWNFVQGYRFSHTQADEIFTIARVHFQNSLEKCSVRGYSREANSANTLKSLHRPTFSITPPFQASTSPAATSSRRIRIRAPAPVPRVVQSMSEGKHGRVSKDSNLRPNAR